MSLQGKWLPPEREVDFYIEMLKRLGSQHTLELGTPPPGQLQKTLKFHIVFGTTVPRSVLPKWSQKGAKLDKKQRLFQISFCNRFLMDLWIDFGDPGSLK